MTTTARHPLPRRSHAANDRTTVICLIETADGAENVDAIAAVKGVDALWVGHFDLSVSLGIPGRVRPSGIHRRDGPHHGGREEARQSARAAWCPSTEQGIAFYKQGFDFCCYSGDVWVLRDGLAAAVKTIREGCK